jgi:sortase A
VLKIEEHSRNANRPLVVLLLACAVWLPYGVAAADISLADGSPAENSITTSSALQTGLVSASAETTPRVSRAEQIRYLLDDLDEPDMTYWSQKRRDDYAALQATDLSDDVPEGILRLPTIDVEFPVYSGTVEKYLTLGAGRIEGTAPLGMSGNTGIASHRDGFFRGLKDVREGDPIQVRTMSGELEYRIVEMFIVDPQDAYVLYPTEEDAITIVTCYPFYHVGHAPQRYIIRAHRQEPN